MKTATRPAKKISTTISLDLGLVRAATVVTRDFDSLELVLAGCGGTGSYLAQHVGRLMRVLAEQGKRVRATFVDPDRVEAKNIGRQLFCDAELGAWKSEALAARYGAAWGLDVSAVTGRFDAKLIPTRGVNLVVLVGCVDNAAGRKALSAALKANHAGGVPGVWWLDCGNSADAGQVLLGSAPTGAHLKGAFTGSTLCHALPGPAVQRPELLKARPEERPGRNLSCAEMAARDAQGLTINACVASLAANMLKRLLVTRDLKYFATEVNLDAGSARSEYATPEAVARAAGVRPELLTAKSNGRRAPSYAGIEFDEPGVDDDDDDE